jgi:hypothetical protein
MFRCAGETEYQYQASALEMEMLAGKALGYFSISSMG